MRTSAAVDYIVCNLFQGYTFELCSNGNGYTYTARKRDILRLITNENISYSFGLTTA